MSVKLFVIAVIIFLLLLLIACYTRFINIDYVLRRNDKPSYAPAIVVYNLDNRFEAGKVGEGFIINDNKLRFFSSGIPPVVIKVSELENGRSFFVYNTSGKKFLLGNIKNTQLKNDALFCNIIPESNDKIVFKSAYSILPYYYGFFVLSPGPVSRYYHYYSLSVKKASGSSLLLEWKFSTYKGEDGKLVPDLFGDNKEGLMKIAIEEDQH